jgi:hypothetical protein
MPGDFNRKLWDMGRKIEDNIKPTLNEVFECNFERSNDIFDIFDFSDQNKKILCEVKGRNIKSDRYKETIVSYNKVQEAYRKIDEGWRVFFIFVFTDKSMFVELKDDLLWQVKLTGTYGIQHSLIPVSSLLPLVPLDLQQEEDLLEEQEEQQEEKLFLPSIL